MREEAKKQLKPISINLVKETLKRLAPEAFNKMIISNNQSIKRCNLIHVRLKYQKVERTIEKIKFPLYASLVDKFTEMEGGVSKHGEKMKIPSEAIFEMLQDSYSKTGQAIINPDIDEAFVFPLDIENVDISPKQSKYFFPALTYRETCDQCYGHKYVNCQDTECNGRHQWECSNCNGNGVLNCGKCSGKKQVDCPSCKGTSHVKCKRCGGDGKINDGFLARTIFSFFTKEKKCGDCVGKGKVPCTECTNGKVVCKNCQGIGKLICPECSSQGIITCFNCYGEKEIHGKTNCPQCQTEGVTGQIVYVKTIVSSGVSDKLIIEGLNLKIGENQIKGHINKEEKFELIYKKLNDEIIENYNEYNRAYARNIEKDLDLYKGAYPMLTKEEISYQVVACVELSYKHMLTNTIHEFAIIDFWNDPEIIFYSEPEQLKRDMANTTKVFMGFFGKLFKTKDFWRKRDLRNEIVLLIYLVKADGIIRDEEKAGLSEMIVGVNEFTNSEKQQLFDIMNAPSLPELTKNNVTFSSMARGQEVLNKLAELANVDGDLAEEEKAFVEKVKNMILRDNIQEDVEIMRPN
jgi:hypothetical protein